MITRRVLLKAGLAVCATMIPHIAGASASVQDFWVKDRSLWLKRPQTGEDYRVDYWSDGLILTDGYKVLCYLLRDATEHSAVTMDVNLLNLLYGIQQWDMLLTRKAMPLLVNSGFRTREHNAHIEGAAYNSMHLYGKAADIRVGTRTPDEVARMAHFFGFGGVGLYQTFTHVDTGRKRFWTG